jgi:hypothetical protein
MPNNRGIGFQPVEEDFTGWKSIPRGEGFDRLEAYPTWRRI